MTRLCDYCEHAVVGARCRNCGVRYAPTSVSSVSVLNSVSNQTLFMFLAFAVSVGVSLALLSLQVHRRLLDLEVSVEYVVRDAYKRSQGPR